MSFHENLNEPAWVQRDEWVGTIACDKYQGSPFDWIVEIDGTEWQPVVVDVSIGGEMQHIRVFGIPEDVTYDDLQKMINEEHRVNVTLISESTFEPPDHNDTVPRAPLMGRIDTVGELLVHGFKRVHMRIKSELLGERDDYEIIQVASALGDDAVAEY